MIEANLTPEELDILQYVREFAQREVKPLAREIDRKKEVPEKLINRMNEMGLFASYIPKEYGGAGLSFSFLARVIEDEVFPAREVLMRVWCWRPAVKHMQNRSCLVERNL